MTDTAMSLDGKRVIVIGALPASALRSQRSRENGARKW